MSNLNDFETVEFGSEAVSQLESQTNCVQTAQELPTRMTVKSVWNSYLSYGGGYRTGGAAALISHVHMICILTLMLNVYMSIDSTPFKPLVAFISVLHINFLAQSCITLAMSMWDRQRQSTRRKEAEARHF